MITMHVKSIIEIPTVYKFVGILKSMIQVGGWYNESYMQSTWPIWIYYPLNDYANIFIEKFCEKV